MEEIKVSIVVPVYKVEKYLNRCVKSLIDQTYSNIEIILVDDGSPDNCGKMCEYYAEKDNRITVVHKENGGLSDARNVGMNFVTGKYTMFVDSDDYVSNNIVSILVNMILKYNVDIACCNYVRTKEDVFSFENQIDNIKIMSGKDACVAMLDSYYFLTTAWGSLIDTKIVKQYPFPIGRNQEDEATTYKYYYASNSIAVTTTKLYGYFQNNEGIMNSFKEQNVKDLLFAWSERIDFFHEKKESYLEIKMKMNYVEFLLDALSKGYKGDITQHTNVFRDVLKHEKVGIKLKFKIILFKIFGVKGYSILKTKQ